MTPPTKKDAAVSAAASRSHKEVLLPMTCLILSERSQRLRQSLSAAFGAGYLAGRHGAPQDQTKLDCVDQLAPALEMELFHAIAHHEDPPAVMSDEPEQQLWASANREPPLCVICRLPWVAHDLGNAGHEFVERSSPALVAT